MQPACYMCLPRKPDFLNNYCNVKEVAEFFNRHNLNILKSPSYYFS